MKHLFSFLFLALTASFAGFSQENDADFAEYGVGLAFSPFGPSLNLTYNIDTKNSISVGIGGAPEGDVPGALLPDFEAGLNNVSVAGSSSWLGVFWRHRPFANQNIGFNLGVASGQIENNLTADGMHTDDEGTMESVTFNVKYSENPVMYLGANFGSKPVKGFQFGLDLGVLSTGGAVIQNNYGDEELNNHRDEVADQMAEISDKLAWSLLPNIQLGVSYGF